MQQGFKTMDINAEDAVELGRLERSLELQAERVGEGRYRVSGGSGDHWVDLHTPAQPRCDCGDYLWRDRICKHILAALLREGNERVIMNLPRLVDRMRTLEQQLRELRKAERARRRGAAPEPRAA